jgi:hypothetical protein
MANDEHIALLKKLEAWNAWRDDKPNVRPNLSEADLSAPPRFDRRGSPF